jgi:hypothetical protein
MRYLILLMMVTGTALAGDFEQAEQAAALRRIANAEEMRNATAGAPVGVQDAGEIEGGGVPEGCALQFLRTPSGEIAKGKGPDGKRHIIYLLVCPDDL